MTAMTTMDWVEDRLARRQDAARARVRARAAASRRRYRGWERDIARASLVASLVVLAIVVVEMSRRATYLIG